MTRISRRRFLGVLGAGATLTLWPGLPASAAARPQKRLVMVVLRGALDGLSAVPAYGDPRFASLRGSLADMDADHQALKLDGTFALHPKLAFAHELYGKGQFAVVHACALPYHGRSHFDAQDCLENGTANPHGIDTGWLNRSVQALHGEKALAIASAQPLITRGRAPFMTWSPTPGKLSSQEDLAGRLAQAYHNDPRLARAFSEALKAQSIAPDQNGSVRQLPLVMEAAGRFLAKADGPRIAMVQDYGWDTHARQNAVLDHKLQELNDGIQALRDYLGTQWADTAVVIATEFGRTVAENGTQGTDHGTGSAVMLAGGAINGGKMHGEWPGLTVLKDNRDLMPANDMRTVFKGVLGPHLGISEKTLATSVFPDSAASKPMNGLIHA